MSRSGGSESHLWKSNVGEDKKTVLKAVLEDQRVFCGSQDLDDLCLCLLESESGGQEDLETVLEDQSGK